MYKLMLLILLCLSTAVYAQDAGYLNSAGGNIHGDSWVTDRANPVYNLDADPVFNMNADPVYNLNADPVFSLTADPDYYDGGADYAYGPDDYVSW